jgi:hypothetical protein
VAADSWPLLGGDRFFRVIFHRLFPPRGEDLLGLRRISVTVSPKQLTERLGQRLEDQIVAWLQFDMNKGAPASGPGRVRRLLQRSQNSSVIGQGHAAPSHH